MLHGSTMHHAVVASLSATESSNQPTSVETFEMFEMRIVCWLKRSKCGGKVARGRISWSVFVVCFCSAGFNLLHGCLESQCACDQMFIKTLECHAKQGGKTMRKWFWWEIVENTLFSVDLHKKIEKCNCIFLLHLHHPHPWILKPSVRAFVVWLPLLFSNGNSFEWLQLWRQWLLMSAISAVTAIVLVTARAFVRWIAFVTSKG